MLNDERKYYYAKTRYDNEKGTVEEWFKAEEMWLNKVKVYVRFNSEKLTQDVEAPASGTLLQIKVQAGEETEVKSVLGIGDEGESTESSSTTESEKEEQ